MPKPKVRASLQVVIKELCRIGELEISQRAEDLKITVNFSHNFDYADFHYNLEKSQLMAVRPRDNFIIKDIASTIKHANSNQQKTLFEEFNEEAKLFSEELYQQEKGMSKANLW